MKSYTRSVMGATYDADTDAELGELPGSSGVYDRTSWLSLVLEED